MTGLLDGDTNKRHTRRIREAYRRLHAFLAGPRKSGQLGSPPMPKKAGNSATVTARLGLKQDDPTSASLR